MEAWSFQGKRGWDWKRVVVVRNDQVLGIFLITDKLLERINRKKDSL